MYKYLVIFIILIFTFGCSTKALEPKVDIFTFEGQNYPCFKVSFPDQIRYTYMGKEENKQNIAIIYDLSTPGYDIEIVKLYSKDNKWNIDPLPEVEDKMGILYKIDNETDLGDRSAVITLEDINGEIYLKGSVALFFQTDRAVRVDIFRVIKKHATFRYNNIDVWKNSTIGRRSIKNMQKLVDFIYKNISQIDCNFKGNINMDWWK